MHLGLAFLWLTEAIPLTSASPEQGVQERLGRGHNHTEGRSPGVPVCSDQLGQPALLLTFTLLPRRRKQPRGPAHLGPLLGLTMWSRAGSLRLPRGCREDGRCGQQVFPSFGPGLICWLSGPVRSCGATEESRRGREGQDSTT